MQTTAADAPNTVRDANPQRDFLIVLAADGNLRRAPSREGLPEDANIFESKEDASRLSHEDLDRITQRILKAQIPASPSKTAALERAWTAMLAASVEKPVVMQPRKTHARIGNTKFELLYDFDEPGTAEGAFKELPPQAQVCLQIMARGGKREYSEAELRELVEKNGKDLQTVQPAWRIFQYYRRRLSDEQLIKAA